MADKNKTEQYRDALELWVKWWNGPGRENYRHFVIPPLTVTAKALGCLICQGIEEIDGGRCQACGRDVSMGGQP